MTVISCLSKRAPRQLRCSSCGATADVACDCGAPYVSVRQRAIEAIAAHPEKSNRAIAAELGVSHHAVNDARKEAGGTDVPRVGRDGKIYPVFSPHRAEKASGESSANAVVYARSHFKEVMRVFKKELSKQDWKELIEWLRNEKW